MTPPVEMTNLFVRRIRSFERIGVSFGFPVCFKARTSRSKRICHLEQPTRGGESESNDLLLCTGNQGFGCPILRPFLA
jgi:hypothetical protein